MVIVINKDDYLLLKDINYSMNLSYLLLKNLKNKNELINKNIKKYKKYINITNNILNNKTKIMFVDKIKNLLAFVLCDFFHLNKKFYIKIINEKISNNMKRIILSNGKYQNASYDIKLLTKYYLSIETDLLMKLNYQ